MTLHDAGEPVLTIVAIDDPVPSIREAILAPLAAYNQATAGPYGLRPLALVLHEGETIVGGLWGRLMFRWLFIELLVVPERFRGRDLGTTLMARAETFAREHDAIGIWLDSFSFQAPQFYEKLGYTAFGRSRTIRLGTAGCFSGRGCERRGGSPTPKRRLARQQTIDEVRRVVSLVS